MSKDENPGKEVKPVEEPPKGAAKVEAIEAVSKETSSKVDAAAKAPQKQAKPADMAKAPPKEAKPAGTAKAPPKEAKPADTAEKEEGEKKKDTTVADLLKDDLAGVKIRRAKGSKNITSGVVHVVATFNNTKVTVTDTKGNVISWSSAGKCNFRGSRKSTAYAAQVVTQDAARAAMAHGLKEVEVHLKGPGLGRDSAVRALQGLGVIVLAIVDKTPVPHNGCRPPKRRRV